MTQLELWGSVQERAQAMEERKRELVESGKESGTSGDDHVNRHRGMLGGAKPAPHLVTGLQSTCSTF